MQVSGKPAAANLGVKDVQGSLTPYWPGSQQVG